MRKQPVSLFIVDDLIRKGRLTAARRELMALVRKKPKRATLAPLALLAWRLKEPRIGIRLLGPIVRPSRGTCVATAEEMSAYAACLAQIGAAEESLSLLHAVDPDGYPPVLFIRMTVLFAQWEYAQSIPLLERFLSARGTDPYQRLAAHVNLAAAYVYEGRLADAEASIAELLRSTRSKGFLRFHANLLELRSLIALARRDWGAMERALKDAERVFAGQRSPDQLFLAKWRAVLAIYRNSSETRLLDEVRAMAGSRGLWEIVRDCDRHRAVAAGTSDLLFHVYFGTPFRSYRDKLVLDYGRIEIPEAYSWRLSGGGGPELDLATGELDDGRLIVEPGTASHRLLGALSLDFYRPQRTASLFGRVYPGEYFNLHSSPLRVRQGVTRLRRTFSEKGVALQVVEDDGAYRLHSSGGFRLRVMAERLPAAASDIRLERLKRKWGCSEFACAEATVFFEQSSRQVRRLLEAAVEKGELERVGRGPATRYRFKAA